MSQPRNRHKPATPHSAADLGPSYHESLIREAFVFLQERGHINFGALSEPAAAAAAGGDAEAKDAAAEGAAAAEGEGKEGEGKEAGSGGEEGKEEEGGPPDEKKLLFKLYEVLRAADMQSTTEKMIRAELSAAFGGLDVSDKKALIKEHVSWRCCS